MDDKKEIIYIEHEAGEFEDGLQVCRLCGAILCDYTGEWVSTNRNKLKGWPKGKIYVTGINPIQTSIYKPKENYGTEDPFYRCIIKCTD